VSSGKARSWSHISFLRVFVGGCVILLNLMPRMTKHVEVLNTWAKPHKLPRELRCHNLKVLRMMTILIHNQPHNIAECSSSVRLVRPMYVRVARMEGKDRATSALTSNKVPGCRILHRAASDTTYYQNKFTDLLYRLSNVKFLSHRSLPPISSWCHIMASAKRTLP